MTEKKLTLLEKIRQCIIKVGTVKAETNPGMAFKTVGHNKVSAKMVQIIKTQNIMCTPNFSDYQRNGYLTSIKCELTVYDMDNEKDRIVINAYGEGADKQDKGIGKAQSYAMKYCLMKLFLMAIGNDEESDLDDVNKYIEDLESQETEELLDQWIQDNMSDKAVITDLREVFDNQNINKLINAGKLHRAKLQGENNG